MRGEQGEDGEEGESKDINNKTADKHFRKKKVWHLHMRFTYIDMHVHLNLLVFMYT